MTVYYPRPILSTSNALAWVKLVMALLSFGLLLQYFSVVNAPAQAYLPPMFAVAWISALWGKCWMRLKELEGEHTVPNTLMVFLFDQCMLLSIAQLLVVFAVLAVTR